MLNFSKKDTLVVKGVAIIFLILYHCFSSVSRLYGYTVDFSPLPQENAMYVFESMNICVGIFSFLSAYGLTKTMQLKYQTLNPDRRQTSDFILTRLMSLLGAFWIPYILCTSATLIFTYDMCTYGTDDFAYNMIADILGLGGLLNSRTLIGTWWYMSFAMVIIFLIPFTVKLYERFGFFVLIPYAIVPMLLNPYFFSASALTNMNRWLLTVPLGVIFADMRILERFKNWKPIKKKALHIIVRLLVMTGILAALVAFRKTPWCQRYFYYPISSILPVYMVMYLYEFVCGIKGVNTVLAFLGRHSSNIFFMHTFIRFVWFKDVTYSLGHWSLIFLFVLAASLVMSLAVEGIQWLTRWNRLMKFLGKKLAGFGDRLITGISA